MSVEPLNTNGKEFEISGRELLVTCAYCKRVLRLNNEDDLVVGCPHCGKVIAVEKRGLEHLQRRSRTYWCLGSAISFPGTIIAFALYLMDRPTTIYHLLFILPWGIAALFCWIKAAMDMDVPMSRSSRLLENAPRNHAVTAVETTKGLTSDAQLEIINEQSDGDHI